MIVIGIDPGLKGAIAALDTALSTLDIWDMPVFTIGGKKVINEDEFAKILTKAAAEKPGRRVAAWVEQVGTRPGEGPVGAFTFGTGYGIIRGTLATLGVPRSFVRPAKWKQAMGLSDDKDAARARAIETWPKSAELFARVKDDGRAEAALLAKYGAGKEEWQA